MLKKNTFVAGTPPFAVSEVIKPVKGKIIWALLVVASLVLTLVVPAAALVGYAAINPAAYAAFVRQAPPVVQPALEVFQQQTPSPDAEKPDGKNGMEGLDSQCPLGEQTIDVSGGPAVVGKRDWIEKLPKESEGGTAVCVIRPYFEAFLKHPVTYTSGIYKDQKVTGLDALAAHYSFDSVGTDERIAELKQALSNLRPATYQGKLLRDTAWLDLPGFVRPKNPPRNPLCEGEDCFRQDPSATPIPSVTHTPFLPMQITSTLTPMPTSMYTPTPPFADVQVVPTLKVFTPQPAVATAMQNVTADQWLELYEGARLYESQHCQHIYRDLDFRTMASSELWAYANRLEWRNGQFGWMVYGNRRDVNVPNYGNYVIYSVCGQVANVPSTSNIDGNGTRWQGGISQFYAPGTPDATTGLIDAGNGAFWVNAYGQWFSPSFPKLGPTEYQTRQPYEAITVINGWDNQYNTVIAVNSGEFPSEADPRVLMQASDGAKFWVKFGPFEIAHINSSAGGTLRLDACSSGIGGFVFAGNSESGDWCIFPGK